MRRTALILGLLCSVLAVASPAFAAPVAVGPGVVPHVDYPGMKSLTFRYGPIQVNPGDNQINLAGGVEGPAQEGFITRFEPNLVRVSDGRPPALNHLHVHHAGWSINNNISFSAGSEKTIIQYPRGFGLPTSPSDRWDLVYMLHNQVSAPEQVYLTWKVDFVPKSSGDSIEPAAVKWLDVNRTSPYGVFDALRGWGKNGRYTFPDQAQGREREKINPDYRWRVDEDVTLVYAVGHIHPGGLFTTMYATRNGVRREIFRSRAKYFANPPNSYDFAMTATPPDWRVKLKRGDVVSISSTVDTSRASWYEQMGVMPVVVSPGHTRGSLDPFSSALPSSGKVTHGSLPEAKDLGSGPSALADPRSLPDGPRLSGPVEIRNFRYELGDLSDSGPAGRPPVISPGQSLSFVNRDSSDGSAARSAYHTVTACRAPCTDTVGSSYPLSDSGQVFDSGQLGMHPRGRPPASGRLDWSTPRDLSPGTYTFFCRVHPSMRGAFRVRPTSSSVMLSTGWGSLPGGSDAS